MRAALCLLFATLLLVSGCGPQVAKEDLGEIITDFKDAPQLQKERPITEVSEPPPRDNPF